MSDTKQDTSNDPANANEPDLLTLYNYDAFVPEKFERWMNFNSSPPIGHPAPDFPLRQLDGTETSLGNIWSKHLYTVVEFGSFT